MLDLKTVRSTTEPRLTLLQYLKTIDKLLEGASLKDIETIRISDNVIKLKFLFGDGSEILSEDIPTGSGGSTTPVETNDGTNGSKILGITIDGKRYSFKDYETNVADLLTLIQGSETVTVDLAEDGEHLEIHLDEIYKQTLVTKTEANESLGMIPSENFISNIKLTEGKYYTPIDNGYLYVEYKTQKGTISILIREASGFKRYVFTQHNENSNISHSYYLPVAKGKQIEITLTTGTIDAVQFVYAKKVGA